MLQNLGIKFFHSEKIMKWNNIMNGYQRNQISRNSYREYYLNKLREFGTINARDFAIRLNKSKRVVNHYLTKLDREGLINVNKDNVRYSFSYNGTKK